MFSQRPWDRILDSFHDRVKDLQFLTRILKFQKILLTKKRDENDVQKVWIRYFGVLHHQRGKYKEKMSLYSVPTTASPYICPVDDVAHRNIGFRLFVHRFRLAFWSIKSFEILRSGFVDTRPLTPTCWCRFLRYIFAGYLAAWKLRVGNQRIPFRTTSSSQTPSVSETEANHLDTHFRNGLPCERGKQLCDHEKSEHLHIGKATGQRSG